MGFALSNPEWVEARSYQQDAIRSWVGGGARGVLQMATGTGKTVTALMAATTITEQLEGKLGLIIAVPYQHLVDQWREDVQDFGGNPIRAYESRAKWEDRFEGEVAEFNRGFRDGFVVVTTHETFTSEAFQRILSRINRQELMLIGDEVHHLGASHRRERLPERIPMRLGLSATPQRFYDDEGSEALFEYFGDVVYEYSLAEAIRNGNLCEYYYVPHVVDLTPEEADEYLKLSRKIARLVMQYGGDLGDAENNERTDLKFALFERARLVGTARNKLDRLIQLIGDQGPVQHTLVYCGDGRVEGSVGDRTERHVDATLSELRKLGVHAKRFTADEDREEREELLAAFDDGDVEALVAIRCLDEGVDVPATRTAYVLASSSNPRQFVQRRGRILRTHSGKQHAVIHDFIVAPPRELRDATADDERFKTERTLVQQELERVQLFGEAARNHPDADVQGIPTDAGAIGELKRAFNLRQL
ncbi:hypothetical protein GCM10027435_17010 [Haloparvum alkalitolerans]|uniref:DEAD/DEAH box helicase family protein n=1 Tax=Haloparvum alkalitolerans TaxID=1042953 RepID=UPI003CFA717E